MLRGGTSKKPRSLKENNLWGLAEGWAPPRASPASAPAEAGAHLPDHVCSKIFVGGLSSETSENDLKEYFSVYGELTDIVVMRGTCEPCTPASARAPLRAPCASRRGRARAGG